MDGKEDIIHIDIYCSGSRSAFVSRIGTQEGERGKSQCILVGEFQDN